MTVVFSTEDVNSYGFWVLTHGINLTRFLKNPVITFNHNTYAMPVGKVKNIRVENNQLIGEVEFDEEDANGRELKRKYENGFMNGFSIGIQPLTYSEEAQYVKIGQKYQTVTSCELLEIAAATIPSNPNAVSLYDRNGNVIELSNNSKFLPSLNYVNMLKVCIKLGLKPDATEDDILKALEILDEQRNEAVEQAKKLSDTMVNELIKTGKNSGFITPEDEQKYRKLAVHDYNLAAEFINGSSGKQSGTKKDFSLVEALAKLTADKKQGDQPVKLLNQLTEDEVLRIRSTNKEEYKRLFFLTYGITPSMD